MLRALWGMFFLAGGIYNASYTMFHPELYQDMADISLLPIYTEFIEKVVVEYPIVFTSVLVGFELLAALLIFSKDIYVKVGLLATLIFTISLVPVAVPYTYLNILLAIIPIYLLRKNYSQSIFDSWKGNDRGFGKSA
jgi:hypothetical protein